MNKDTLLSKPFGMSSNRVNRRSDDNVRSAIDTIQNLLFDPQAPAKIFPLVMQHMVGITHSDYGVIFTGDRESISPILPGTYHTLHCEETYENELFIDSEVLSHWIEQKLLPLRPVFFNDPVPKSHSALLMHPEEVKGLVILPIISHNELQGVCLMAKREGEYTGEMIRRLMPLLGSVVCALQSAETVRGDVESLNQKISDDRFLSTLISTSLLATLVVDEEQKIVVSNPAAHDMFCPGPTLFNVHTDADYGYERLNEVSIYDLIPKFDNLFKWSNQHSRYGEDKPHLGPRIWEDQVAYRVDHSEFIVNISVFRYTLATKRYTALQIQDITAMHESAEEYQKASQQLNALTHLVPVGIIRVDINWNCVFANDKWYEFSGLNYDESMNTGWINAIHSDDVTGLIENLREALQVGTEFQTEFRMVSPLGQTRWVDLNAQVLFDEQGAIQGFLATFADITERLVHQEKLRQVAEYDALTGLANRHLFQDRLQQAFLASKRERQDVIVFFLDLDGFKDINDTLGHATGDKLLQEVANRLSNTLRRNDTVARFGGDEFVILLSAAESHYEISSIATKIIETVATPYLIEDQNIYVTTSLGIAMGNSEDSCSEKILKQADAALYLAKAEGKNNFQLFNHDLDKEAKNRVQLIQQLRVATDEDQFFLVYQPQAYLDTEEVIGFEALLRVKNEDGEIILPDQFIPVLEETGMIVKVGQWVIEETCRQLQQWNSQEQFPTNGFLSVNVSPKQLLDKSFISIIINACNKYQVNPSQLVIEVTETVIIDKPQRVQEAMHALKHIGVKLALDDFGTGYSSLTYLQRYPFDHIKIDKSFVADLLTDVNDAKITKAIIALAQSLGLKITAEGVSDNESLEMLRGYGADYFQGYILGKPLASDEAILAMQSPMSLVGSTDRLPDNVIAFNKDI